MPPGPEALAASAPPSRIRRAVPAAFAGEPAQTNRERWLRPFTILRTQAYRIVLIYLAVFAISVTALLGFTYWTTKRALEAETDRTIEAEITGLSEQYQQLGLRGLAGVVLSRSSHGGSALYLLANAQKLPTVGNLDAWPTSIVHSGDFVEFDYQRRVQNALETRRARGRVFKLASGFNLLVAQDVHERYLTDRLFTRTLPWTVGLVLLVGLVGGAVISRNMLARLDSINRTSADIMAGDLSRRVPRGNAHDEFDVLAENLNAMLDRIERLMSGVREVTDSVAHDLRTPLNRIRNRLEGTLRHLDPANALTGELEAAVEDADRLIATFNALLLIAEADAGVARGAMVPIDLAEIARDMGELYAPVAEEKGVRLDIPAKVPARIDGNRSLISQALSNLADNAIKYTAAGGRVTVSVRETAHHVELCVADMGPGIAETERARVLERFVRLEASRSSPGTGLGLSLVSAVARLHDAQLVLGDNRPGLRAIIRFPKRQSGPRAG